MTLIISSTHVNRYKMPCFKVLSFPVVLDNKKLSNHLFDTIAERGDFHIFAKLFIFHIVYTMQNKFSNLGFRPSFQYHNYYS